MTTDNQITERNCIECGEPIEQSNKKDICFLCRIAKTSPEEARKRAETLERKRLMKELDMPPNAAWQEYKFDGSFYDEKGQDYSIELFGMLVNRLPTPDDDFPYFRIAGMVTQVWLQRVRYRDSPIFGEIKYHPNLELTYAIKGDVRDASNTDVNRVKRGIHLLTELSMISKPGRPLDSGIITEANKEEMLNEVIRIGRNLFQEERKITQSALAKNCGHLGFSDSRALQRLITEYCRKDWKKDILPKIKEP